MTIMPAEDALPLRGPGRPPKYPWSTWMKDTQTVQVVKGRDFYIPIENMRVQINKAARRYGGRVVTRAIPDGIQFTFYMTHEEDFEFEKQDG